MFKNNRWFWSGKPKNPHSLEHLKYLYNVMSKNQTVMEQNKTLLVETLRLIAEILIWGDQNDSTVFDFFLEKNMLSFFLKIMRQKCGSYVCVQLLQTLNILFENIRNETSLYYLLSNNHVNSIIVHKFDFSDEEVMAYYISFLKTLSLKLNPHTIHFFFNEHTNDFPLYTEAIKFFNHNEKMVRIAVRTLTLNVFRVDEKSMLKFIRDRTAAPYFSNLVWFIGIHVIDIDTCLRNHQNQFNQHISIRLDDLVAEHLDHLHYMNDILLLQIDDLNHVLSDHLLNRLLIPLYIYSLDVSAQDPTHNTRPRISLTVSLFLLTQVFLIINHMPLVEKIVDILLNSDITIFDKPEFAAPPESLEQSLIHAVSASNYDHCDYNASELNDCTTNVNVNSVNVNSVHVNVAPQSMEIEETPLTDEEKAIEKEKSTNRLTVRTNLKDERPFLRQIYNTLDSDNNIDDQSIVFVLCLLYAIINNTGINNQSLINLIIPDECQNTNSNYEQTICDELISQLIEIMRRCCQYNSRIRLITMELSILLIKKLVIRNDKSILSDHHLAAIEQAKEEAVLILRNFFKSEEEMLFLDMFEDEYQEMQRRQLNVEYLMMDANLLLPPNQLSPLMKTGVEFNRRLPCADVERTRFAIHVFFLLRQLSLSLGNEKENQLPLTNYDTCVKIEQLLDLNNSDLIGCTVLIKDQPKMRRFMVIDLQQLILIEPDTKRLGWGITKFVAFLQDVDVSPDKDDSRSLQITIRQCTPNSVRRNMLNAKFVFDDHIRCLAAKQRLTKGRIKSRQRKMQQIAKLIEFQLLPDVQSSLSPSAPNRDIPRSHSQHDGITNKKHYHHHHHQHLGNPHKPLCRGAAVPGSAVAEFNPNKHLKPSLHRRRSASSSNGGTTSRDSSPRAASSELSEEMIPLEDLSPKQSRRRNRSKSENRDKNDAKSLTPHDKCERV